jgi:multiple sugar transport system permease protein
VEPVLEHHVAAAADRDRRDHQPGLIWNFNSFGLVYVLTAGGPGGKTMLPMLFAYNEAFRYGNFGMAAAMGDVMVVIIIVFLAFYLRNRLRSEA